MCPNVVILPKLLRKLHKPRKDCLIVRLLGKSIGYNTLCSRVNLLWNFQGDFAVVDLDCGFFLFKINNKTDYCHVFTGGPWVIMNHYLTVRKWEPNFKLSEAMETNSVIWMRLPEFPIEN